MQTDYKSAYRFPWYLYLISVAIAIPSITALMVLYGVLHSSSYITTILVWGAVAVVSIWSYRMPRRMYYRKHYQQEEKPLEKYPWYLYVVSIVIFCLVYFVIIPIVMILANNIKFSSNFASFFQMIFPLLLFSVLSVWAFMLPRRIYDKKHRQQEENPTLTD